MSEKLLPQGDVTVTPVLTNAQRNVSFFKNLFKPIKSPMGEVVSDEAYGKGIKYMTDERAQQIYAGIRFLLFDDELIPPFADWLEAQGVRLV